MSKITDSARDEPCTIRIPGVCNRRNETVVFCHDNGAGMGAKWPDTEGAYGCSSCHDVFDRRAMIIRKDDSTITYNDIRLMFYEGARRTRIILIEKELIKI